jgi:hypothetical protein
MRTITCPDCHHEQRVQSDEVIDEDEMRCPNCGFTGFYSNVPERESMCCGAEMSGGTQCIACGADGRHFY